MIEPKQEMELPMKKLLTSLFVVSLLLSGCGNSEEENIDNNTGKEQLIIAMDTNSAPYSYLVDGQNEHTVAFGKSSFASGYDVLIARDLAKSLKKDLVIKRMSSDTFVQALDDGDVDLVMNGLMDDGDTSMSYSSPYMDTTLAIVVRKDDELAKHTQLKQFKKVKMLGQSAMASDRVISQVNDVKHQDSKVRVNDMIIALKTKKSDAIVVEKQMADKIVQQNENLVVVSLDEKKDFKIGKGVVIGFKEGSEDEDLYKKVETFIKKLKNETKESYLKIAVEQSPILELESKKEEKK